MHASPFSIVDEHGQVLMTGSTLDTPPVPAGCELVLEAAPPDHYRVGDAWRPIPAQPSMHHVFDWSAHAWADPRSLDDVRAAKLAEINTAFARASAAIVADYPAAERMTWASQEAEALAWSVDPLAPTPYLDGIAAARGIDVVDMRQKTLDAVSAFRAASQWLVGTRQALRDAIHDPAATRSQIEAIAWPAPRSED